MADGRRVEFVIIWIMLLLATWPADRLLEKFVATLPPRSILRASDTVLHGIIGALSWRMICLITPQLHINVSCALSWIGCDRDWLSWRELPTFLSAASLYNMEIAFALASAVDLDHIIKDVIHVAQGSELVPWERGWFHYVMPPLLFTVILYISSVVFRSLICIKVGTLVLICIIGHHIRDALHHGLWLQPLGVTPVFPFWFYVCLTMFFPIIIGGIVYVLLKRVIFSQSPLSIILV